MSNLIRPNSWKNYNTEKYQTIYYGDKGGLHVICPKIFNFELDFRIPEGIPICGFLIHDDIFREVEVDQYTKTQCIFRDILFMPNTKKDEQTGYDTYSAHSPMTLPEGDEELRQLYERAEKGWLLIGREFEIGKTLQNEFVHKTFIPRVEQITLPNEVLHYTEHPIQAIFLRSHFRDMDNYGTIKDLYLVHNRKNENVYDRERISYYLPHANEYEHDNMSNLCYETIGSNPKSDFDILCEWGGVRIEVPKTDIQPILDRISDDYGKSIGDPNHGQDKMELLKQEVNFPGLYIRGHIEYAMEHEDISRIQFVPNERSHTWLAIGNGLAWEPPLTITFPSRYQKHRCGSRIYKGSPTVLLLEKDSRYSSSRTCKTNKGTSHMSHHFVFPDRMDYWRFNHMRPLDEWITPKNRTSL